jgi:hypothetical protein
MMNSQQVLERIEEAQTTTPFCEECGMPTTISERDAALKLVCTSLVQPRGRIRSLLNFDFATLHTNRQVVELSVAA